MLRNYFTVACRNLWKNKFFSAINVVGLATGIAACLLTFFFIRYEKGFDLFHPDDVYRLVEVQRKEGADAPQKIARTMFPMGPTLKEEFSEIIDFARIISLEHVPLQEPGKDAIMATWCGADASFLRIFGFQLITGDASTALAQPGSIILTQNLASQLFGSQNPLGRIVRNQGRDTLDYTVTGILQNVPEQSHLQFDAIFSFSTALIAGESDDWENDWMYTYLQVKDRVAIEGLEAKLPAYLQKYMGQNKASQYQLLLQPIRDIHLWSGDIMQDLLEARKFNGRYLPLLAGVAFLVLALAIINYVNLTTARSITRIREIAVRKTNGAGRMQITYQFLGESILLSAIAMLVALLLVNLLFPLVNFFSGRDMQLLIWKDPFWLLTGGGIALTAGLLAGVIPAASLVNIQPIRALRGQVWASARSPLRNALVVVQFTIAVALSVASISAFRQLKFMQQYDLGFNKEEVLVAQVSWTDRHRVETLMNEVRALPGVQSVTGSLRRLGDPIDKGEVIFQDAGNNYKMPASTMYVDYNYIPFYQIELLAGRNISPRFGADAQGNSYLINKSMAKKLLGIAGHPNAPLTSLIGKPLRYSFQDSMGTIIGITRDFNFNSLHNVVEPLCLTYEYDYYFKELSIRIRSEHRAETLTLIAAKWKNMLLDQQFDYYFLDSYMEQLYKADEQTGQIMSTLTLLALFISSLGLIALASYNTERRTKEIGIRKVLGASVQSIMIMLSKDFIKLVVIAIFIAIPSAWYTINKWLEGFAYRIQLSWWMFFIAGLAVILIALVTVSYQSIKTALMDPVKSLRSE